MHNILMTVLALTLFANVSFGVTTDDELPAITKVFDEISNFADVNNKWPSEKEIKASRVRDVFESYGDSIKYFPSDDSAPGGGVPAVTIANEKRLIYYVYYYDGSFKTISKERHGEILEWLKAARNENGIYRKVTILSNQSMKGRM